MGIEPLPTVADPRWRVRVVYVAPHSARYRRLQPRCVAVRGVDGRRIAGRGQVGRRGGGPRHRRLRVATGRSGGGLCFQFGVDTDE
jgi:hypothetical protein